MIDINEMQIDAEISQIIIDLRTELRGQGIYLLEDIKDEHNNNIQFTCPSHADGHEHKPSCGVSTIDTWRGDKKYSAGTVHCFTCGYTATLTEFISFCFGYDDRGKHGIAFLKANYAGTTKRKRECKLNFRRNEPPVVELEIPESILDTYRYIHPYMYERGLTDDIIDMFDVGYDSETKCITFPVKDLEGKVRFVQTRSVISKFHHYASGVDKTNYVYGAYECMTYYPNAKKVWVCESILNCLTLWKFDIPAVAIMGTGGGRQYDILKKLPYRQYVIALDPDEAGEKAKFRMYDKLKGNKILREVIYPNRTEDINDLDTRVLDLETRLIL